jgi:pyruvate/2-oxoacid:ferredoxin oxidoreductase beta subunit
MARFICMSHQKEFERSPGEEIWCPGCVADEITRIQGENLAWDSVRDITDDTAGNIHRLRAQGERDAYENTMIDWKDLFEEVD